MPMYDYICECCEQRQTRFLSVSHYKEPQYCANPTCGQFVENGQGLDVNNPQSPMRKLVVAPAVFGDYEGYISPATGEWVQGKKAHLEDLKKSGCRIFEPGERQQEMRRVKEREEAAFRHIDECVEKTAHEMGIGKL